MKTIDISWRRYILPNINNEGWRFVGIFAAATALLAILWAPLGWIGLVLTVWCYYFFRDPERVTPNIDNVVVSPADGIVQMIAKVKAPEELGMGEGNSEEIEVSFTPVEYEVKTYQGKFSFYDEQEMQDPMVVDTGLKHSGDTMINTVTASLVAKYPLPSVTALDTITGTPATVPIYPVLTNPSL